MTDDKSIIGRIDDLVAEEKDLRAKHAAGQISDADEHARLKAVEIELDQCWDLLRQRQARRQYGQDPDGAAVRPVSEVEGYQQ